MPMHPQSVRSGVLGAVSISTNLGGILMPLWPMRGGLEQAAFLVTVREWNGQGMQVECC